MSEDRSMLLGSIKNISVFFERIVYLFIQSWSTKTFAGEVCFGMCWAAVVYCVVLLLEVSNSWVLRISPCHFEARWSAFI